ncbi:GGDEF domain-containing protein [Clostridium sp. SM-530-WT-3G]|uniref:GGDEF domain-containing protein n=1 Tax=Clostridium sp. SM-530-WT-3G TaxID=2725303 RepID=UPI00145DB700|nr:GGDEF domain-containing protein [Clostridium sp. SM-530-WT-3G]NME82083.1 GGDEF domain-containing protein [Clostridium sp. SM-530-WT-3G]
MNSEISQIFKYYSLVFDTVRIVDPIKKKVILNSCSDNGQCDKFCFELLKKDGACTNCTSVRAYNERKKIMKIEYVENKLYMIISAPIEIEEKLYIFEFIKDITDETVINNSTIQMQKEIDRINLLSVTDELTGAYNRRFINEYLSVGINDDDLKDKCLSITIMDIDFFKTVNDTYGHSAGDFVLKEIVKLIKSNIRSTEWIARYGGEEFVIVFNHNKSENIINVIDRIRKTIEEHEFFFEGNKIKVKASFGVACRIKDENINTLLEIADKKLYEAKNSGRNKVVY